MTKNELIEAIRSKRLNMCQLLADTKNELTVRLASCDSNETYNYTCESLASVNLAIDFLLAIPLEDEDVSAVKGYLEHNVKMITGTTGATILNRRDAFENPVTFGKATILRVSRFFLGYFDRLS